MLCFIFVDGPLAYSYAAHRATCCFQTLPCVVQSQRWVSVSGMFGDVALVNPGDEIDQINHAALPCADYTG